MSYLYAIIISLILGGQPYILTVDHITPQLQEICRKSSECMDIEVIDAPCVSDLDCCQRKGDC